MVERPRSSLNSAHALHVFLSQLIRVAVPYQGKVVAQPLHERLQVRNDDRYVVAVVSLVHGPLPRCLCDDRLTRNLRWLARGAALVDDIDDVLGIQKGHYTQALAEP